MSTSSTGSRSIPFPSSGERLNYFSPYARLSYALGENSSLALAYSSGNARPDLGFEHGEALGADADLRRDLSSVGLFPRTSVFNDQARIQKGHELELAYSRKFGSRRLDLSAYRETVSDAALSVVGPAGLYDAGDLLPDLFTGNAIFNAGTYSTSGYNAALTQDLGQNLTATVMYGTMPGLSAGRQELVSNSPDELRSMIHASHRQAVTARVAAAAPWAGTHIIASYQWLADSDWLTLGNLYSTQPLRPLPGLNIFVRQPIPGLPWRVEATVEMRNLLAQGYLPLQTVGGQQVLLVETPRIFRGGLSFIF
jgi:hypothetical protein